MKKIVVQTDSCIGCGACIGIDAEHFEFSDDGFSVVKSQEHLDSEALMNAIDACPVAIISLEETDNDSDVEKIFNEEKICDCNHEDCLKECYDGNCNCEQCNNEKQ
ncbi:MAG: ferredoxin [Bacilli bacterium]|nr:ferredoxin [Bacilli bacterium]